MPVTFVKNDIQYDAESFPGYVIGSDGSVYSTRRGTVKLVTQSICRGYPAVNMVDVVKVRRRVHRLVATCFIPNPDNLPEVDHIDRNKLNNNAANLRWVSATDNSRNKCVNRPVTQYTEDWQYVQCFASLAEAGDWLLAHKITENAKARHNICSSCRQGGLSTAYGYRWTYTE